MESVVTNKRHPKRHLKDSTLKITLHDDPNVALYNK
jgi:hypothetical protein